MDLEPLERSVPTDLSAYEYAEWRYRMCRGVRTPEDLPWAPTREEIGHTVFIEGLATITTKSMFDEFHAVAEDRTPLPFPISGFPKLQVYGYDHCKDRSGAKTESPTTPPTLQHTIHRSELPDILLVSDPDEVTLCRQGYDSDDVSASQNEQAVSITPDTGFEISYRRTDPLSLHVAFVHPPPSSGTPHVARLHLTEANTLGVGHSAQVYSSTIQFHIPHSNEADRNDRPASPPSNSSEKALAAGGLPQTFTVAAKIPYSGTTALGFAEDEACIYEAFPEYLSQSYDGFYMVPKDIIGTPAVPVVPNSYGYYTPIGTDKLGRRHKPILLIEKCGAPIAQSREQCAELPKSDR